jgi:hypothetical protein
MKKVFLFVVSAAVFSGSFGQYTLAQKANVVSGVQIKFTPDISTEVLTTVSPHGFASGDEVVIFTQSATPPSPLAVTSYYYAIVTGTNTLKLATTPQNALAGTAIDITTTGSGLHAIAKNNATFNALCREALRLACSQILDGSLTLATINASPIGTFSATQDQVNTFARRALQSPDSYVQIIMPQVINQSAFQTRGIYSLDADIITCVQNVIKIYSNL